MSEKDDPMCFCGDELSKHSGFSNHMFTEITEPTYKVWMTQGQGCRKPDAECGTLSEALDIAASMFGEGSVGIELPNGSWHEFGEEWKKPAKVTLLRMRKNELNPKQKRLIKEWYSAIGYGVVKSLQRSAHSFQDIFSWLDEESELKHGEAQSLFFNSLAWGCFDIFEVSTGVSITDEQIDWLIGKR